MKICFLVELHSMWQWDDGLRGAMKILEKKYEVVYHLDGKCNCEKTDIVFAWGGTLSNTYKNALTMVCKRVLLFAGGPRESELFKDYDMVCFENEIHTNEAKIRGIKCITAFGTDTNIFKPMEQPKIFDVIYPAAFGLWKRNDLFAKAAKGLKALALGNIQHHELECWNVCVENNIAVSADIPQSRLPYFYAMSHTVCVLPVSFIGGQRTVLEAMAMKLPVIVPSDAPLVCEFVQHGGTIVSSDPETIRTAIVSNIGRVNEEGHQYVMKNLTEKHYARSLEKALSII